MGSDIRAYLSRVIEELKDPIKRQTKSESEQKEQKDEETVDIDEADYVPEKSGMTVLVSGSEGDSSSIPMAQREIILKEIAAFRERSNRRERNKAWLEAEVEKATQERDRSPNQNDRRQNKDEDRRSRNLSESIPSGPAADRRRGTRDYHQSVRFNSSTDRYDREEDDEIPDEEVERRRLDKKRRDLEIAFSDVCPINRLRIR
jgi:RNA-binding protein 25